SALNVTDSTGASKLFVRNDGNVGIGTMGPAELLHISGASGLSGATPVTLRLQSTNDGTWANGANYARIDFANSDTSGGVGAGTKARIIAYVEDGAFGSGGMAGLQFQTTGDTIGGPLDLATRMTINRNGNVGIGTTSPSALLSVHGNSYVSGTSFFGGAITATSTLSVAGGRIYMPNTTATYNPYLSSTGQGIDLYNHYGNALLTSVEGSNLLTVKLSKDFYNFYTSTIGGTENMLGFGGLTSSFPGLKRSTTELQVRLADDSAFGNFQAGQGIFNGNVGIGTTSPWGKLAVENIGSGNSFLVGDVANDSSPFVIDNAGNVGIGTTTPAYKLTVAGSGAFSTLYAQLPGVLGSYFNTPNSTANTITGDIDIRVNVALDDWTSSTGEIFFAKYDGGTGNSVFAFDMLNNSVLRFAGSLDGLTFPINATATALTGFADGTAGWVRVTRESSSGDIKFYTSTNGITWTQLGTTVSATAGALFAGNLVLDLGSRESGTVAPLHGRIYRGQIYNGINGTLAVDFNPNYWNSGSTWVSATGETWTINGTASISSASTALVLNGSGLTNWDDLTLGTHGQYNFQTSNGSATTTKMVITNSGNVGIGTTSPLSRLSIQGEGATSATSALNVTDSTGASKLFVRNDGNVGIGTMGPAELLHISGASGLSGATPV
ncbi:MAG: hypothetical protein Q7J73_04195, partial [Dehalococcoidales bacterium]|nr:hypothetical protein [Dehalococcoidales bacterium]